jgi:phosphoglycerol transferase MdoB-like AlkP superfamily enzyme
LVVNLGDTLYFDIVHRHVGRDLFLLTNEWELVKSIILEQYLWHTIVSTIILSAISVIIIIYVKNFTHFNTSYTLVGLLLLVIIFGIRQNIDGKPFGIPDTFVVAKPASGSLAVNGVFSAYRSTHTVEIQHTQSIAPQQAILHHQQILTCPKRQFVSELSPLTCQYNSAERKRLNIVLLVMESWSAEYIDSISSSAYGVTPNFDKLSKEGIVFTNFYANGQRSIEGLTALLTGVIQPEQLPNLGWGLELYRLNYLGRILRQEKYTTLAIQSASRRSFRLDAISSLAGFSHYYGSEDFPKSGEERTDITPRFGSWDGDMLRFLYQKLKKLEEPFFTLAFTATTHAPFYSPGKKWEKYQHNNRSIEGYLNTLYYSDEMLGEFFDNVKTEPWFDNTLFFITADHTVGMGSDQNILKHHHIPLLIFAPNQLFAQQSKRIGSQVDIFPTIMDVLGVKQPFSVSGTSLFSHKAMPFAFLKHGQTLLYVKDEGYIHYNYDKIIDSNVEHADQQAMLYDLKSIDIAQTHLIKNNLWTRE